MKEFLKAINTLAMHCVVKVLKIDLNTGTYKIVHLDKGEYKSNSPYLNDWVNEAVTKDLIREDYSEAFKTVFSFDNLKSKLKYSKYIHYKFARKCNSFNDEYRMSVITVLPIENGNSAYLIVYDINDC